MHFSRFLSVAFAAAVSAESLANVLAANNGTLSTLSTLLATVPEVQSMLSTAQNITILAPSNDAFKMLLQQMPNAQQQAMNQTLVTALLQYHVMPGMMMAADFTTTPKFVSTMLQMPFAMVTGGQKVELLMMDKMAMVFSGFKQMSTVVMSDVMFDGGVVHVIDKVLTIPQMPSVTAVDTGLTSLAGALTKTNLVTAVDMLSDATIFAPSNAAFESIGSAVNGLSTEDLGSVLSYHVVHGSDMAMFSANLAMMNSMTSMTSMTEMTSMPGMAGMRKRADGTMEMNLNTLAGGNLTVRMENGNVFVNSAKVIMADVITMNGVVHVIDNVLNPMNVDVTPNPTVATQMPAFSGAVAVAEAPFTSGISATTTIVPTTMTVNGGAHGALPTAALMGVIGGAAALANL